MHFRKEQIIVCCERVSVGSKGRLLGGEMWWEQRFVCAVKRQERAVGAWAVPW